MPEESTMGRIALDDDAIELLAARLNEAEALALARVLHALADAGLIDECHVFGSRR
jgi:hypothetical protein